MRREILTLESEFNLYCYMFVLSCFSRVQLFVTLWTVACQAPQFMGFSRQEYWSQLLFPFPEEFPNPVIKPESPALQADSLPSEPPGKPSDPCLLGNPLPWSVDCLH